MQHLPEILKIIEGGVKNNATQVASYASLLADKLESEGLQRDAGSIRKKLNSVASPADLTPHAIDSTPLPVDRDSRLTLGDLTLPILENSQVQLNDQVKEKVNEFLEFIKQSHLLTSAGVGITPSMLIYGPPGCGKTQLANNIAAHLQLPLITARCDTLVSSFLGATAKNLRSLFDHAASRPCVLFLDEFDAFAKARDDHHELGELKRVVVSLLQNIDSLPEDTILLAATNHEELLDAAVWRRFAYRIKIPLPNPELRKGLIEQFLGEFQNGGLATLADVAKGMNGAVIKQACQAAIRKAIISGQDNIDNDYLTIKLAQDQYTNIIDDQKMTDEEKVVRLKNLNAKLFTISRLSAMFGMSTGKISKLTSTRGKLNEQ
ncbi:AAA family ATPase [Microbulbifer sp. TRSA001]|uniref:AAA family ATPase n=1 Tax=Microbulbifer sp. TRSA001 TaxID=3243381 RepID=UPI004039F8C1